MRRCVIRVLPRVLFFCNEHARRSYAVEAFSLKDRSTFYGVITMIVTFEM